MQIPTKTPRTRALMMEEVSRLSMTKTASPAKPSQERLNADMIVGITLAGQEEMDAPV